MHVVQGPVAAAEARRQANGLSDEGVGARHRFEQGEAACEQGSDGVGPAGAC